MAMNPRLLRPVATGFDPRRISGLELWLDGSDSSTITLNSTAVSEWRDKSGKGNTFTQSVALNQPTFVASSKNGRSAINFPNVAQMNGPAGFSFAQPTTWFVLFQAPTTTGQWSLFDGNTSRQHIFGSAPTSLIMFAGSSAAAATIVGSTFYAAVFIYNGASSSRRLNSLTATTVNPGGNAITGPRIGANNGLRGDLCEIGMFSKALSDTEATAVMQYLSKKWAVTI